MKRNQQFLSVAALFVCASYPMATASFLTPAEALARVGSSIVLSRGDSVAPVYTGSTESGKPAYYVFDAGRNNGFMILSASDAAVAMLGYSDKGSFSADSVPPQMQWWLEQYAAEIESIETSAGSTAERHQRIVRSSPSPERSAIAPITVTTWDQGSPYNAECPEIGSVSCYTGCVATATAQVMKVHNWPEKGSGSNSYTWNYTGSEGSASKTLSLDFSDVVFDWANMIDSYAGAYTDAQKEAVAGLMHAVGIGVSMQYGTSESGAQSVNAAVALLDYFGYDPGLRFEMRNYYTLEVWEDMVYESLAGGMPVLMGGSNDTGGHEFVCDGYSEDGYFHFNWGWSGMSDGYFKLTALNPESQGAGGTTSGYNYRQDAVFNIRRPSGGTRQPVKVGCYNTMNVQLQDNLLMMTGGYVNITPTTGEVLMGVKLTDATGAESYIPSEASSMMKPNSGYNYYGIEMPQMPDGTYDVYPVYSVDNGATWQPVMITIGHADHAVLTYSNQAATSVKMATLTPLDVENVTVDTPVYIGSMFRISGTVVNPSDSESLQNVYVAFVVDNGYGGLEIVGRGYDYPVDVPAGGSVDITYQSIISEGADQMEAGTYQLVFVDEQDNIISQPVDVTVNAAVETSVSATEWTIVADNLMAVDKNSITVRAVVSCTEGYYAGAVSAYIFPAAASGSSVRSLAAITSPTIFLNEGESQTVTFTGSFPNGESGTDYFAMLRDKDNWLSENQVTFRIADKTGTEDIFMPSESSPYQEYYNLQGMKVSPENLTPGIYIVHRNGHREKMLIR
ncbi:MAG: C10 family peptidase [Muribaculaceae bacterium]|nr:C10 family peptidase [Muribaculaceae bacterium]